MQNYRMTNINFMQLSSFNRYWVKIFVFNLIKFVLAPYFHQLVLSELSDPRVFSLILCVIWQNDSRGANDTSSLDLGTKRIGWWSVGTSDQNSWGTQKRLIGLKSSFKAYNPSTAPTWSRCRWMVPPQSGSFMKSLSSRETLKSCRHWSTWAAVAFTSSMESSSTELRAQAGKYRWCTVCLSLPLSWCPSKICRLHPDNRKQRTTKTLLLYKMAWRHDCGRTCHLHLAKYAEVHHRISETSEEQISENPQLWDCDTVSE